MAEEIVSAYDWKITLKKWASQLIILLIITGLTFLAEVVLPELQLTFPEYAGIILVITPIIIAIINYLKHRNDTKVVNN